MASPIASLSIDILGNIAGFTSDLKRADREAERWAKDLEGRARKAGAVVGTALAAGFGLVSAGVKAAINEMDRIGDVADRIGVGTEALTALGYAARQSGAETQDLDSGLTKLSKTMADAAAGGEKQKAVFDAIGVSVTDAKGNLRDVDDVFLDIADRFKGFKDGAGEVALAQSLMGRGGAQLIPVLNEGSEGLRDMADEGRALGVVLSEETVAGAQALNDNLDKVGEAARGVFNAIAEALLPSMVELSEQAVEGAKAFNQEGGALDIVTGAIKGVVAGGIILKNTWESVVDFFIFAGRSIAQVWEIVKTAGKGALGVLDALQQASSGNLVGAWETYAAAAEDAQTDAAAALKGIGDEWDNFSAGLDNNTNDVADALAALYAPLKDLDEGSKQASKSLGTIEPPLVNAGVAASKTKKELTELRRAMGDLQRAWDREIMAQEEAEQRAADATRAHAESVADLTREFQNEHSMILASGVARDRLAASLRAEEEVRRMNADWMQRFNRQLSPEEQEQIRQTILLGEEWLRVTRQQAAIAEEFRDRTTAAYDDVENSLLRLITTGEAGWGDFLSGMERSAEQTLGNIADLFQRTVMTPGGGGMQAFGQQMGANSMYGAGGRGGSVGGWASAAGSAYAGWQQAGQGNRLGTIANFTAAGATIGGPWGAVIGAVVGIIVAFARTVRDPQIRLAGSQGRIARQEGSFDTVFGQVRAGSAAGVKWEQYVDGIRSFDKAIFDMVSSFRGAEPRLAAIRATLSTWSVEYENSAASLENVLQSRFSAILGTFEPAIQEFVLGGSDLKDQMERFGDALAAEAAFVAAGIDDIDFAQFLTIVDEMAMAGESTGDAVRRIVGGMGMLGAALDVMGVDINKTGEEFVRFATAFTEAAGGLEGAQSLWDDYFRTFYSPQELGERAVGNLRDDRDERLNALGIDPSIGLGEFRELFEQVLPTLSAEATVQWLEAARAIGLVIDAEGQLAQLRSQEEQNANDLRELIEGLQWDDYLAGLTGIEREIAKITRAFDDYEAQAIALGATEDDLIEIRRLEEEAIRRLTDATEDQTEAVDDYWATIAQIALDWYMETFNALRDATAQVRDFLAGMALGPNSSLSPQQQLASAQANFQHLAALAATGDENAIRSLTGASQSLLNQAASYFGVGSQDYLRIENMVRAVLGPIAEAADNSTLEDILFDLTRVLGVLAQQLGGGIPGPGTPIPTPPPIGSAVTSTATSSAFSANATTQALLNSMLAEMRTGNAKVVGALTRIAQAGGRGVPA